jgi:hypothetical protein
MSVTHQAAEKSNDTYRRDEEGGVKYNVPTKRKLQIKKGCALVNKQAIEVLSSNMGGMFDASGGTLLGVETLTLWPKFSA